MGVFAALKGSRWVGLVLATVASAGHAAQTDGRWHAGLGDNSAQGWLTVALYALACAGAATLAQRERREGVFADFWLALALLLLALGVNKQLDLQSGFTEVLRDLALGQGWYGNRRVGQVAFIGLMAVLGVCAAIGLGRRWPGLWLMHPLTCAGGVGLGVFVLVRAASFHQVDALLHVRLGPLSGNGAMEMGALALILAGQWRAWFWPTEFAPDEPETPEPPDAWDAPDAQATSSATWAEPGVASAPRIASERMSQPPAGHPAAPWPTSSA